jgi:hypothetical protein
MGHQEVTATVDVGGSTFTQNVRTHLQSYMVSNPSQNKISVYYIFTTLKFVVEMRACVSWALRIRNNGTRNAISVKYNCCCEKKKY